MTSTMEWNMLLYPTGFHDLVQFLTHQPVVHLAEHKWDQFWVTIRKPNSFTTPPNFALSSFVSFLILRTSFSFYRCSGATRNLPCFAFILGRIAFARPERTLCLQRISQIRSSLHCFFVTLATPNLLLYSEKLKYFWLFLRFSVTLQPKIISVFIKGYEIID